MKKIPTLFERDPETNLKYLTREVHPDCQWVIDGLGVATYKWNGTAVKIDESGIPSKRREVKLGRDAPPSFEQEGPADPETGKIVGWVPVELTAPEDRYHLEGFGWLIREWPESTPWPEGAAGTYELVGPKVQGNPHGFESHKLIRHGGTVLGFVPTDFDDLAAWLREQTRDEGGFEGVVWHHPDGRMAKIKVRDFPRPEGSA